PRWRDAGDNHHRARSAGPPSQASLLVGTSAIRQAVVSREPARRAPGGAPASPRRARCRRQAAHAVARQRDAQPRHPVQPAQPRQPPRRTAGPARLLLVVGAHGGLLQRHQPQPGRATAHRRLQQEARLRQRADRAAAQPPARPARPQARVVHHHPHRHRDRLRAGPLARQVARRARRRRRLGRRLRGRHRCRRRCRVGLGLPGCCCCCCCCCCRLGSAAGPEAAPAQDAARPARARPAGRAGARRRHHLRVPGRRDVRGL
ncbi:hypothetical protein HK405_015766, partial [Cladochytrium tenue]